MPFPEESPLTQQIRAKNILLAKDLNVQGDFHVHGDLLFLGFEDKIVGQGLRSANLSTEELAQLNVLHNRVHQFWIEGFLKNSIQHEALIALGMESRADAIDHPWSRQVAIPDSGVKRFSPAQGILEVFEKAGQCLLILGEPGAGKTTTLLELARELLDRRNDSISQPVPVVFNLSTWRNEKRQGGEHLTFVDWLAKELASKYRVPRELSLSWLRQNLILPLLDGLDEVLAEQQCSCVQAINQFIDEVGVPGIVVSSRWKDYLSLSIRLRLNWAIRLLSLTSDQVEKYLLQLGDKVDDFRRTLQRDPILKEFSQSPLMLNIMILIFRDGVGSDQPRTGTTPEETKQQIFSAYVRQVIRSKGASNGAYSQEQTVLFLSCLARKMRRDSLSMFRLEDIKPGWIEAGKGYFIVVDLISGLSAALIGMMLAFCFGISMASAAFGFAYVGVVCFAQSPTQPFKLREVLNFSWQSIAKAKPVYWVLSILFANFIAMAGAMDGDRLCGSLGILPGILASIVGFLLGAAGGGLLGMLPIIIDGSKHLPKDKGFPNQGTIASLKNGMLVGASLFLVSWITCFCFVAEAYGMTSGLAYSSIWGIGFGLAGFLGGGANAAIQHYILRLLLFRRRSAPLRYVKFLDNCEKLILLRKVGGGYIFTHRMLLDYFADLPAGMKTTLA